MSTAPVFLKVGDLVRVDYCMGDAPVIYDEGTRPAHLGPHEVIGIYRYPAGTSLVSVRCTPGNCVGGVWGGFDRLPDYFLHEDAHSMCVWERVVLDRVRAALLARGAP